MPTPKLTKFAEWNTGAKPGDIFVYHKTSPFRDRRDPKLFAFARELFDAGRVILYQRPVPVKPGLPRQWEYVARACSDRAHEWCERMGHAAIPEVVPFIKVPAIYGRVYGSTPSGGGGRRERTTAVGMEV